jgi:energy-coupling factor transporter ATP-binding protein EcfA2
VLDEPTNDLDAETLELLEDRLLEYTGTILLVSHDRTFLNNVVTSTIVLEGEGRLQEYVGGYDDWVENGGAACYLAGIPQITQQIAHGQPVFDIVLGIEFSPGIHRKSLFGNHPVGKRDVGCDHEITGLNQLCNAIIGHIGTLRNHND